MYKLTIVCLIFCPSLPSFCRWSSSDPCFDDSGYYCVHCRSWCGLHGHEMYHLRSRWQRSQVSHGCDGRHHTACGRWVYVWVRILRQTVHTNCLQQKIFELLLYNISLSSVSGSVNITENRVANALKILSKKERSVFETISVICSYSPLRSCRLLVVCPQCDPSLLQPLHSSEHQVSTRNFTLHNFWSRVSQLCSWMSPKKTHLDVSLLSDTPISVLGAILLVLIRWIRCISIMETSKICSVGENPGTGIRNTLECNCIVNIWGFICAKKNESTVLCFVLVQIN